MDAPSLLRMVAEETRYQLLTHLRRGPVTVGALVEATEGEQTNISHHLRTLRDAGLVRATRSGRHQEYSLAEEEVGSLLEKVEAVARELDRVSFEAAVARAGRAYQGYG